MGKRKQTKHAGGRPRIDPASVAAYHLGLRFPDEMRDKLLRIVDAANDELESRGLPRQVTPSSVARKWIEERLAIETEKLHASTVKKSKTGIERVAQGVLDDEDDK